MLKKRKIIFVSLFASSLILFANDTQTTKLDEVTVSANKMEENIQDVPQSISVIDEETIEQKGIRKIQEIIKEVPNMNIMGNTGMGNNVSFRGLNASVFTNSNPVVVYIDGVPYYDRYDYDPSLVDVEQVEVLRGPQGTLYGKDAIGAVINIVTKNPKNDWSGTLGAEYGNDNTYHTRLNTSGAIIDNKLFAGINGSFDHSDGWITNHYPNMKKHANEKNNRKSSAFLLYKPTDELSTRLTVTDNYSKNYFMDGFSSDPNLDINSLKRNDAKNVSFDVPTFTKSKAKSQALQLFYELDKFKIDSTTTHKKFDLASEFDADNRSNNLNDGLKQFNYTNTDTWTQELKLSSKNQDIKWVTGLYLDKEKRDQGPYGGQQWSDMTSSGMGAGVFMGNAYSTMNSNTYAIFGQTMIPLGNDFELTLGGRYQKVKKDIDTLAKSSFAGMQFPDIHYVDKKSWNTFLPKAALSYKVNDNLKTYISISKGYMPGGFNYYPSSDKSSENSFEPQKSLNYEIGAKYIGDSFALNTSIFRMNIEDIHVYKQLMGSNIFATGNAKKAHSQGIEIDGTYFFSDNLSIFGSLGIIKAKYDEYDNGNRTYNGENIEYSPQYTANFGISYLANSGIYGRVDLNAIGKTTFIDGANNDRLIQADGGITANAKIGYKIGTWDLYGYITNITNEDYITSYLSKNGSSWVAFNEPRRFGIGAIYKF
ncbi:TonB-dependent receptor [Aliarcobacter lanthieri]|uniref:TonB-dependent receptor n=1 Tax=Aliarcobacter lanthieri TaxID=1355374 RepID=UPI00047EDF80|nr:TonB-dependent receptor [Aliarcobacter lanthieri]QKF58523.1 TonB-dependent siderophore receptor [Aliarcobacter lanthieri]